MLEGILLPSTKMVLCEENVSILLQEVFINVKESQKGFLRDTLHIVYAHKIV